MVSSSALLRVEDEEELVPFFNFVTGELSLLPIDSLLFVLVEDNSSEVEVVSRIITFGNISLAITTNSSFDNPP
jgi:hypothetical protein